VQGYFLFRPLPVDEATDILKANRRHCIASLKIPA